MIQDKCCPIALAPLQSQGNQPNQCTNQICGQKTIETIGFMVYRHFKYAVSQGVPSPLLPKSLVCPVTQCLIISPNRGSHRIFWLEEDSDFSIILVMDNFLSI